MGGCVFRGGVCWWLVCCAVCARFFDRAVVGCVARCAIALYGNNRWFDDSVVYRFLVAIMVTTPFALYQVWRYVAPGLHKNEKKFVVSIFVFSPLLFVVGVAFAFYLLFPFVFRFFIELNESAPVPAVIMPAVRDYIGFAIGLLKVFGIAFQLPLVLVLLNRAGVLPRARVVAMRRYAIIFIVIAAAVLTPPDIVSQILLAVPMLALFELSILFMKK